MLLGSNSRDLGDKLSTGSHIGAILGPSLAILWVMLKLSRARVGHVEAVCQMLFGHVVGFVSQSAPPPGRTKISSGFWFWRAMLDPFWVSNARIEATFWGKIGEFSRQKCSEVAAWNEMFLQVRCEKMGRCEECSGCQKI